jgi:hypothetical protein
MAKHTGELSVYTMVGPFFYSEKGMETDPTLPVDGVAKCRIASQAAGLDIPFASKTNLIKLILNHCCTAKVSGAQDLIEYYWDQSVPDSWASLFVVPRERLQALGRVDVTTLDVH